MHIIIKSCRLSFGLGFSPPQPLSDSVSCLVQYIYSNLVACNNKVIVHPENIFVIIFSQTIGSQANNYLFSFCLFPSYGKSVLYFRVHYSG